MTVITFIKIFRHNKIDNYFSIEYRDVNFIIKNKGGSDLYGIIPAMLYGLETVAVTKRQEAEMEVAELKMLRSGMSTSEAPGRTGEKERNTRGKTEVVWTCMEER